MAQVIKQEKQIKRKNKYRNSKLLVLRNHWSIDHEQGVSVQPPNPAFAFFPCSWSLMPFIGSCSLRSCVVPDTQTILLLLLLLLLLFLLFIVYSLQCESTGRFWLFGGIQISMNTFPATHRDEMVPKIGTVPQNLMLNHVPYPKKNMFRIYRVYFMFRHTHLSYVWLYIPSISYPTKTISQTHTHTHTYIYIYIHSYVHIYI